jgi:NAD+ diphosphatase
MIQDIGKGRYHNEYRPVKPSGSSRVLGYRGREALVRVCEGQLSFLTYEEVQTKAPSKADTAVYLFSIDETAYFWIPRLDETQFPGMSWQKVEVFRNTVTQVEAFAGITGFQLAKWYESRRFCPRCGAQMRPDERERMMRCDSCGQTEYPKISPAVIVGVTDGERLLMTKYAGRSNKNYALIAGFTEIGETIEETVEREVFEEVGLHVKNLRYYKSQPWSFSDTILMGFFAEVDGAKEIHLDEDELAVGEWHYPETIPEDDGISLTREMMRVFKEGHWRS